MPPESARGAQARAPRDESATGERTDPRIVAVEPGAFDSCGSAQFLCISRAHFMRLVSSGRAPAGAKLGARRIWSRTELASWLEAGCPPLVKWQATRGQAGRRP